MPGGWREYKVGTEARGLASPAALILLSTGRINNAVPTSWDTTLLFYLSGSPHGTGLQTIQWSCCIHWFKKNLTEWANVFDFKTHLNEYLKSASKVEKKMLSAPSRAECNADGIPAACSLYIT